MDKKRIVIIKKKINTFKVAFQWFYTINTVFYLKINFKLKIDPKI